MNREMHQLCVRPKVARRVTAAALDLDGVARHAALAMGVEDAWKLARHRNGRAWAMLALAYLHRRLPTLGAPGPYLLALCRRSAEGRFDLLQALRHSAPAPG
ncbi:hypothetical protein [Jannaschia formosa]|uniref:hypothetical protein n=1 Tax=Jannaschia formosa TaxID=2259592 RepID=UPI000E1BDF82|nr:hypothetical protein [Jannaschia formosa]TFL16295.1 hypothetical protein DR046_20595 [Jannaschia formosa]